MTPDQGGIPGEVRRAPSKTHTSRTPHERPSRCAGTPTRQLRGPWTGLLTLGGLVVPEMELYVVLFVSFTTAAVSIIVNELLTAAGSPLDTVRSIIQDMWRAASAGAVFTVTMAFVFKTVRLVSRCLQRVPFRSRQSKTESDR